MSANEEGRAIRLRVRVARPHVDPMVIDKHGSRQSRLVHPNHGPDVGVWQERRARNAVCRGHTGQKVCRGRKAIGNQHAHVGPCTFPRVVVRNVVVCAESGIRPYVVWVQALSSHDLSAERKPRIGRARTRRGPSDVPSREGSQTLGNGLHGVI